MSTDNLSHTSVGSVSLRSALTIPAAIMLVMILCATAAWLLKPTHSLAPLLPDDYGKILPRNFGDWVEDSGRVNAVVNPQTEEMLGKLYSQVVTRTYVHLPTGRRLMVSIAYGADQSRANQVHKPEVCYPAQGFQITSKQKDDIKTGRGIVPVMRILSHHGSRHEPITYWIRLGEEVVRGTFEQNAVRLKYGLKGDIPDGLLFRISEIQPDSVQSFRLQDRFVNDLLNVVNDSDAGKIVGYL